MNHDLGIRISSRRTRSRVAVFQTGSRRERVNYWTSVIRLQAVLLVSVRGRLRKSIPRPHTRGFPNEQEQSWCRLQHGGVAAVRPALHLSAPDAVGEAGRLWRVDNVQWKSYLDSV